MILDHQDYIKLVKAAYDRKRLNDELSPHLAQSTPANIRRECVHVYKDRYDKRDDKTLRTFFGPAEHGKAFLQLIENFPTDRFRPLDNYLKKETETTDDRNLELLAWLIDFRHRPWGFKMDVNLNEEEHFIIGKSAKNVGHGSNNLPSKENSLKENEKIDAVIEDPEIFLKKTQWKKKRRRASNTFLIVVACLGSGYFIWQQVRTKQMDLGNVNTGCMYWKDDHYEQISCNDDRKGIFKLPLDTEKMKNFKKIMREDTITEKSIGKIHYIRIDKRIEYYTTSGNHPIDVTRALKPLSPYMFEKHLLKRENINEDSVNN